MNYFSSLDSIANLVLLFFVYSFAGWCIEVTLKYIQFHRFINRGFFTGPLLPIYGSGAVLITVVVGDVSRFESAYGTTFAISFILCGALEYAASYFMEKRFHARWWDYSQKPMNLHGRIWIGNLVLFGLGGVLSVNGFNPLIYRLLGYLQPVTREWLALALLMVFAADFAITHFVLKLVKTGVEKSEADNTEQINREVRALLTDRGMFHRRFAEAYPEVIYRTERINARMAELRAETERLRAEAEQRRAAVNQRIEAGRDQFASSLELTSSIKNDLIEKQYDLLRQLYDEQAATDAQKALMQQIRFDQERLKSRRISSMGKRGELTRP